MRNKGFVLKTLMASLIVLSLIVMSSPAEEMAVNGAHTAAVEGLPALLSASPLMQTYNRSAVSADKESGFQIFVIDPKAVINGEDFGDSIIATPLYCFLVKQGDAVIGLTTVEKIEGKWEILTFGAAGMAAEVNQILNTYSEKNGYTIRYLRSYQTLSDYFQISKDGEVIGIVPLTSGRMALGLENKDFDPETLIRQDQISNKIGQQILENLNSWNPSN